MTKKALNSKLLLAAILLTFVALAAKTILPKKTLTLAPISSIKKADYFLVYYTNNAAERNKSFWVDKDKYHFHCSFTAEDHNLPCNVVFLLSKDGVHGTNLSKYNDIYLDLSYQGNAKSIRIAMRNFDARFSVTTNDNSAKFNYINLRTSDIKNEIRIGLDELVVADWWISQFNLSRDLIHPDLNNVTAFTLDFPEDLSGGEHDIYIHKIEFVGDWISNENWYLLILLNWLFFGAGFAIYQLISLRRNEQRQLEKISALVVSNSKLRLETDKFRKLSTVDALTNAFNRHGIEQIIESLEQHLESTSIIMIDVDYFKRVNDRRGHDAGDRVLQKISEIILSRTRASDKLGRWGGEEFILICPNTPLGMAVALAEKLRIVIFDNVFEPSKPLSVTASFGVAAIHNGESFTQALKRVDEALYKAKSMGRNCVTVAESDQHLIEGNT